MKKPLNKIYIEITNVCNLGCTFCPKTSRTPELMSFDLFKHAIAESKPLSKEVTLHLMGEPTLHPKFKEFLDHAAQEEVSINLTTNGTRIKEKFDVLLTPSIKKINFSIHSIKNNYTKEKTAEFLHNIMAFTKYAQERRTDLIIIYRLWNINDASNKDIFDLIEEEFNTKINNPDKKGSIQIFSNTYIQYDDSFDWPDTLTENNSGEGYCHGLSTHLGILSNGTVVPCCLDSEGNIPLGNINEQSISEIMASPRAMAMKKGFQERRLVEDMCKKCTFIKRLERNKP